MRIRTYILAAALVGAVAAAQVPVPDQTAEPDQATGTGAAPTSIPDIPAGADPMDREPDPAEGSGAAMAAPRGGASSDDTTCRVERADTDTGFVVVCE